MFDWEKKISYKKVFDLIDLCKSLIYVIWDIHSKDMIPISNYWKYPKQAALEIHPREIISVINDFPEDVYLFSGSLEWAIALTHEEYKPGKRICYLSSQSQISL